MNNFSKIILYILLVLAALSLVYTGFNLILKSIDVYSDSKNYLGVAIKADTSLKGKITTVPNYSTIKEGYSEALLYFTLALGVILLAVLLPRLQSLSFGGVTITLKDLQEQVNDLKTQGNDLTEKYLDVEIPKDQSKNKTELEKEEIKPKAEKIDLQFEQPQIDTKLIQPKFYPNDPQKGQWGVISERNGRKLSATVKERQDLPDYYLVNIKVTSTSGMPLKGLVNFHLHNTFINPDPIISVINNEANLYLKKVYGAFTVGAEMDNGNTRLELDLAELKDAPKKFKER